MKSSLLIHCLAIGAVCSLSQSQLIADTVFNNGVNDLNTRFNPGTLEVGDEIVLAAGARYMTNFSFEYWGVNTSGGNFGGSVQARVRFYQNDGSPFNGYATPGTSFYDSGWFSVSATSRSLLVFQPGADGIPTGGLFLPSSDFTWSVQFQGLGPTDQAGVDLYSPPTVGQDYPDYWQYDGTSWALMTNSVAVDFGAQFDASITPVPEPTVIGLLGLGAAAVLTLARRRK